jgi:hypothetical protein
MSKYFLNETSFVNLPENIEKFFNLDIILAQEKCKYFSQLDKL